MKDKDKLENAGMISINCVEWNGYFVLDNGVICNKDGSIKRLKTNDKGYYFTNFYYNNKPHCHLAHTVIWMAFNGSIPEGYEVDHIDNDRKNNKLSNLQILTKSENNKKSYTSGNRNFVYGQTNPNSLTRRK